MKHAYFEERSLLPERICLLLVLLLGSIAGFWIGQYFLFLPHLRILIGNEKKLQENNNSADNTPKRLSRPKENQKMRILCWLITSPINHRMKARHVKRTWGKHCDKLIFTSSAKEAELDSVALPIGEGRNNLWGKTKEAYKYIYEHHINDADWFLKADDDTYTIVENMRYMLYPYNPETPVYFGCKFKPYVKQGYMSGGAGYVLSREAVRRLVEEGLTHSDLCQGENDIEMKKCIHNLNITSTDLLHTNDLRTLSKNEPLNQIYFLEKFIRS